MGADESNAIKAFKGEGELSLGQYKIYWDVDDPHKDHLIIESIYTGKISICGG